MIRVPYLSVPTLSIYAAAALALALLSSGSSASSPGSYYIRSASNVRNIEEQQQQQYQHHYQYQQHRDLILGGILVDDVTLVSDFGYYAGIYDTGRTKGCGGTISGTKSIVTSAKCLKDNFGPAGPSIVQGAGLTTTGDVFDVEFYLVHPDFNDGGTTDYPTADIAIVYLTTAISTINGANDRLIFGNPFEDYPNTTETTTFTNFIGFGATDPSDLKPAEKAHRLNMTFVDFVTCNANPIYNGRLTEKDHLCFVARGGVVQDKGGCKFDEGR